ncbi:hypothetical protein P9209_13800 [Prescottella defluvii]|nr:hypothetical protein P9209_13800 [Prescottella defluvii]
MTTTASPVATQQQIPQRTNTAPQIALFCALIGLAPIAIVFGVMAAYETDRRPYETGGNAAVAAVTIGIIEIVVVLLFAFMMIANIW